MSKIKKDKQWSSKHRKFKIEKHEPYYGSDLLTYCVVTHLQVEVEFTISAYQ
jgi:hypothetical protein